MPVIQTSRAHALSPPRVLWEPDPRGARSRIGASSPSGNGMVRKRSSASDNSLPACRIVALVTA